MFGRPQRPEVPETTATDLADRLNLADESDRPLVVDVREPNEWQSGHIAGALHIPLGEIMLRKDEIPPEREVVLVCHMGSRSEMATTFLRRQGYAHAINLRGGMDAWERAGLPTQIGT